MTSFQYMDEALYKFSDQKTPYPKITPQIKEDFEKNGFVIIRDLFSLKEISKINQALEKSQDFHQKSFPLKDTEKLQYFQYYWTDPGSDILGVAGGSAKTVGISEQLLNKGEMYIYHAKVVMKQPRDGAALLWHQDYGYWYNNRALFPDFVTCVIALTESDFRNGGLQVFRGSHLCGRINHSLQAGQTGADMGRIELLKKKLEKVQVSLKPGDALFFHANTLHSSEANRSDMKRWHLIYSYNTKDNSPDIEHYSALYTPLPRYSADAIEKLENLEIEPRQYDPKINPNITYEG